MGYAVTADGWRRVTEQMPLAPGEIYAETLPEPSLAEQQAAAQAYLSQVLQAHMDQTVGARGYGSMVAVCSYRDSGVAQWRAEAQACIAWRDALWVACFALMEAVRAGTRAIPSAAELLAELPVLVWPEI